MRVSRITVAICTWNRAPLLEQTLDQVTQLHIPEGVWWELLVVNNNCTDDTDAVIERFSERLPIIRLFEPTPGLSHARNRAVREASGDYLIWTDDDVLVSEIWLAEYCSAFERHPDATVFGGPVTPWFPNEPPSWLTEAWSRVYPAYACIDLGGEEIPLDRRRLPYGANMSMRMDHQRAFMYDPTFGVRPGNRMGGEELDVERRSLASGGSAWWVPGAKVRHYIPEARQTLTYLRRYFDAYGEYLGRYESETLDGYPTVFGRPRWLWRVAIESELRYRVLRWFRPPVKWMGDLVSASTSWGTLRGFADRAEASPSSEASK